MKHYKMKRYLCFSLVIMTVLAICLTGCNLTSDVKKTEEVKIDSIQVEKIYHLLDNPDNPNCNLVIDFNYPVECPDKTVLPILQKQFVVAYFGDDYAELTPQEAVNKYVEDYITGYKELEEDFKKDIEENETPGSWYSYYEMSQNEVVFNEGGLLSFTVSFENYTGGAHGSHSYTNFTLNTKDGKRITEEDLFVEDYQDSLAKLLIDEITKKNNLQDPKGLEDIGYFSVDEIYPNNNFYIDATGITYTFNEYEIASYALGQTEVHLSFEQIMPLLKEGSPVAGMIK